MCFLSLKNAKNFLHLPTKLPTKLFLIIRIWINIENVAVVYKALNAAATILSVCARHFKKFVYLPIGRQFQSTKHRMP